MWWPSRHSLTFSQTIGSRHRPLRAIFTGNMPSGRTTHGWRFGRCINFVSGLVTQSMLSSSSSGSQSSDVGVVEDFVTERVTASEYVSRRDHLPATLSISNSQRILSGTISFQPRLASPRLASPRYLRPGGLMLATSRHWVGGTTHDPGASMITITLWVDPSRATVCSPSPAKIESCSVGCDSVVTIIV